MFIHKGYYQEKDRISTMSYQSYNPDDDATQLVRPSPGYWPQQGQAPREKLVLGNFSDQPQSSQRRPYQYQPSLAQQAGPPAIPPMRGRQRRKGKGCTIGCLTMLVLLIILVIFTFTTGQRVMAFGSAIS